MVREDEGGLQDGEGLGVGAGCRLVDGDIQGVIDALQVAENAERMKESEL